jgi:hypothetical protein
MSRAFKTFLVWLLLAVLPLHAVAANGMACASVHAQSSPIDAAAPSHAAHGGDAHAHHGEHASQMDHQVVDAAPEDSTAGHQQHSGCSACSAFCLGAVAPPSAHFSVPAVEGSDAVVVAPVAFAVGFIQDGPQRPPRRQSA